MSEQPTHSPIGASSAKRWLNCAGSVGLISQLIGRVTSKYAAEGSVAHNVAEKALNNIDDIWALSNTTIDHDGRTILIDGDMLDAASLYAHTIFTDMRSQKLLDPSQPDPYHAKRSDIEPYLSVERKFTISSIDSDLYGTCDACICVPFGRLTVYDFKYGKGVTVEAEENEQLMFYALGVAEELGGLDTFCFTEVELVIVQPRAINSSETIKRWRTTPERLLQFAEDLKAGVSRVRSAEPEFKTGSWCKFCDAKLICQAVKDDVIKTAQIDFAPIDYDSLPSAAIRPKLPPPVLGMTADTVASVLDKAPIIRGWLTAVEAHALQMVTRGEVIPGYKAVAKRANREWINEAEVAMLLADKYGDEIYAPVKLKTPAQLEKVVGKESLKILITTKINGYNIVRVSDKRPAVIPLLQDFTEDIDDN